MAVSPATHASHCHDRPLSCMPPLPCMSPNMHVPLTMHAPFCHTFPTSLHMPLPLPHTPPPTMHVPPWPEWLTDRCKNITFPQLRLRAERAQLWIDRNRRKGLLFWLKCRSSPWYEQLTSKKRIWQKLVRIWRFSENITGTVQYVEIRISELILSKEKEKCAQLG